MNEEIEKLKTENAKLSEVVEHRQQQLEQHHKAEMEGMKTELEVQQRLYLLYSLKKLHF